MLRRLFTDAEDLAALKEVEDRIYAMRELGILSAEETLIENVVQIRPTIDVPIGPFWTGGTTLQAQAQ